MTKSKIIKLNEVRGANTLALLGLLIRSGEISRVEMAAQLNCDNTTVTRAVRDLTARGLVESVGKRESAFGRPRELLRLDCREKLLLGAAIDPKRIVGVLTDFRGGVQYREELRFDALPERKKFLAAVSEMVRNLKNYAGNKLCGAGFATFGSYADDRFTITDAACFPQLNGVSLLDFLKKAELPDAVIADKLTASLVQLLRCGAPELRQGTTLLLYAGSGIGMALASEGKIILTRRNHGGELGHTLSDPDGELCACGRRGCLETVASGDALLRRINKRKKSELTLEEVKQKLSGHDRIVCEEAAKSAFHLGAAAADRVNTLFPEHLVFSGPLFQLGRPFQEMLCEEIQGRLFPLSSSPLSLHFQEACADDETAAAIGAALMAGDRILSDFARFDQCCPVRE